MSALRLAPTAPLLAPSCSVIFVGAEGFVSTAGAGERERLSWRLRLRGGGDKCGPLLSGDGALAGGGLFLSATYITHLSNGHTILEGSLGLFGPQQC